MGYGLRDGGQGGGHRSSLWCVEVTRDDLSGSYSRECVARGLNEPSQAELSRDVFECSTSFRFIMS